MHHTKTAEFKDFPQILEDFPCPLGLMSRIRNNHLNWKIEEKYYFTQLFDTDDSKFKDFPLIVFF